MAENVFFTADTHLGHERLLSLGAGRPFASAGEMTEALVERWNARVGVDCTGFAPIAFEEVAERLSGRAWAPLDHHRSGHGSAPPSR